MQTLSPDCRQLVQQNERWQQLVAQGKFEESKALAAMACTKQVVDDIYPMSVGDARNSGLPALSTLGKYRGKDHQMVFLQYVLTEINVALGEKKALSPQALQMLGKYIAAHYFHWNLAEVKHAIQMGIQGAFSQYSEEDMPEAVRMDSKIYGTADVPTVIKWFQGYDILKAHWAAEARQEEHALRIRRENEYTEQGRALMLDVLAKLKKSGDTGGTARDTSSDTNNDTVATRKRHNMLYRTIEEYCQQNEIDQKQYLAELDAKWKVEYHVEVKLFSSGIGKDVPYELYKQGKYQKHLLHLNNSRQVA